MKIDLSILILKGNNLRNLHKLILNIQDSISQSNLDISYEILISKTSDRESYLQEHDFKYIKTAPHENLLILAKGKFLAIIEEDSLVSPNWFTNSLSLLDHNPRAIYHTQVTIFTPKKRGHFIWTKLDSTDSETITSLSIKNQWDYPLIGLSENITVFSIQDLWSFIETSLSEGIQHLTTPETVSFTRKHPHIETLPFMHYSSLYAITKNTTPPLNAPIIAHNSSRPKLNTELRETLRKGHVWMKRRSRIYRAIVMPILKESDQRSVNKKIDNWTIDAWKQVHEYDRTTFPTRDALRELNIHTNLSVEAGIVLQKMLEQVSVDPDYIYLSQHMMKGGGDKVVLNYINAMQDNRPDWKLMLIVTEEFDNNWQDRVPETTQYLDFWKLSKHLDITTRYIILMRFIVQMRTKKMLLAMTPFGFEMVEHYQDGLIESKYQIDSVAFCSDTDSFGRTWGIHFFGIPENFPALHKIVTDNLNVINETTRLEPLSRDKFSVHYQPVNYTIKKPAIVRRPSDKLRILWASRVANQKRPDIVKSIGKQLSSNDYSIHMYGNIEDEYTEHDFKNIPSIEYRGGFDGFSSLPIEEYDVLLYTSSFDGVPNILLEATASGLPLVAPKVGGINEFIEDKKTGVLVNDIEDIDAFISALAFVKDNPDKVSKMTLAAQKKLSTQHSYEKFKKSVLVDLIE